MGRKFGRNRVARARKRNGREEEEEKGTRRNGSAPLRTFAEGRVRIVGHLNTVIVVKLLARVINVVGVVSDTELYEQTLSRSRERVPKPVFRQIFDDVFDRYSLDQLLSPFLSDFPAIVSRY